MSQMTNEEFGAAIGVSDSYASYLRSGQRSPSGKLLVTIIFAFDLPRDETLKTYQEGPAAFGLYLRERVFTRTADLGEAMPSEVATTA